MIFFLLSTEYQSDFIILKMVWKHLNYIFIEET